MSGSVPDALYFDMESLSGRHPASAAALVLTLLLIATSLVAVGTRYLCQNDRPADADPGYARISLYLLTVLLSSLALVARAKYPSDYYLMVPGWALVSWIACTVTIQSFDGPVLKCMTWAVTAALAAAFVHARITDYGVGGAAGQQVRDAKSIYAGYNVISRTCPAGMSQGLKLAFTRHPVGEWWYFRGVAEHPDQLVGAYICHDGQVPPMAYSFDGNGLPDHPGQVVAKWDNNFVVTSVSKHGAVLYSSADH
jgi:hypothetical protein